MSDPIDRQAAINAVRKAKDKSEAQRMLIQMPPAQPSVSKTEIVGDTISRQAAIKAICEDGTMLERQGKYTMTMAERKQKDADILDTLPPAQPEIIRCKACRYNNDCEIQYKAQSGDEFFCGCAERKDNG